MLREHSNGKLPDGRASSAGEAGGAAASAWDVFPGQGCAAWVFSWQQGCSARSAGVRGARLCQPAACPPCTCWYGLQTPWGAPLQAPGVALRNPGYRCCPEGAIENTAASLQKAGGTLQTPWGAPLQTLAVALQTLERHCKPRGTVVNPQRGTANRGTPPQTIRAALQTSEHLYRHPRAALQTCHMQPLGCSKAAGDCSPALLSPSCSSSTGTWHAVTNPLSPYLQEWSPMMGSSPLRRGCGEASCAPGPCAATLRTWSRCCGSWLALRCTSRLLAVLPAALPVWSQPAFCFMLAFFLLLRNVFSLPTTVWSPCS